MKISSKQSAYFKVSFTQLRKRKREREREKVSKLSNEFIFLITANQTLVLKSHT